MKINRKYFLKFCPKLSSFINFGASPRLGGTTSLCGIITPPSAGQGPGESLPRGDSICQVHWDYSGLLGVFKAVLNKQYCDSRKLTTTSTFLVKWRHNFENNCFKNALLNFYLDFCQFEYVRRKYRKLYHDILKLFTYSTQILYI